MAAGEDIYQRLDEADRIIEGYADFGLFDVFEPEEVREIAYVQHMEDVGPFPIVRAWRKLKEQNPTDFES